MLQISGLSIDLSGRRIVDNFSLSLEKGNTLALMGPSGCGKTTVLKTIAGFLTHLAKGEVGDKHALWQNQRKMYVGPRLRPTTLVFQELAVWPHLSARQQLDLIRPKNLTTSPISTDEIIEGLMLGACAETRCIHLSGGEKQRVAIGRALKTLPDYLLLDEPFNALDEHRKDHAIGFIKSLQNTINFGIIISTHDKEEARALDAKILNLERN